VWGSFGCAALGYGQARQRISDLYTRHSDEFTDAMTAVVKLSTEGGEQEVRIFSPRGGYALGMFARTKIAKAFRVWVLDILDKETAQMEATLK
jgi:prophage antirepressor-like protein